MQQKHPVDGQLSTRIDRVPYILFRRHQFVNFDLRSDTA